jgi:hypothetical protein
MGEHFHDFTGAIGAPVVDQNNLIRLDEIVYVRMDLANNEVNNLLSAGTTKLTL